MIDHNHELLITRQCVVLGIAHSTVYDRRRPISEADYSLMQRLDALHLERPFLGSRRIADRLADEDNVPVIYVDALQRALARYRPPEIFNTDQGSQFTRTAFIGVLKDHAITISIDGRGRRMDNVFTERLWRSVKLEEVYLKIYDSGRDLRAGLADYVAFYNTRRHHQSLDRATPDRVYFNQQSLPQAA